LENVSGPIFVDPVINEECYFRATPIRQQAKELEIQYSERHWDDNILR